MRWLVPCSLIVCSLSLLVSPKPRKKSDFFFLYLGGDRHRIKSKSRARINQVTSPHNPLSGVSTVIAQIDVMTPSNSPYLVIRSTSETYEFPLVNDVYWTVGRSKDNNILIPNPWISRSHAFIQKLENGAFYLIDLGSRNGTFVNGRRVNVPTILNHLDEIMFGQTEILFYNPQQEEITLLQDRSSRNRMFQTDPETDVLHERRLISVMVVDIRNFTQLSRELDNNTLSQVVGTWFRQVGDIIKSSGSWVDKYIGDAVMSIWFHGETTVDPQQLINIFQAVSELNQMTTDLQRQLSLPHDLRIGAGINTGYAMIGNTGTGDRPDYTAIGDTVNAAFRLESATKEIPGDLAIGAETFQYLDSLASVQQHFVEYQLSLKGYDQPITAYGATFEQLDYSLLDHLVHNSQNKATERVKTLENAHLSTETEIGLPNHF